MARISELHYSNAYASSSGVNEFLEVSLAPDEMRANYVVAFYQSNGQQGLTVTLDNAAIQTSIDAETGETVLVISADDFPIYLTDPDGGGPTNYEAYALVDISTGAPQVIDFYDIGGGTQNVLATDGPGNKHALRVSPQHRMLIQGVRAHMICGAQQILIAAVHPVNGRSVRRVEWGHRALSPPAV